MTGRTEGIPQSPRTDESGVAVACPACGHMAAESGRACPSCGAWRTGDLKNVEWRPALARMSVARRRLPAAVWVLLVIPLASGIAAGRVRRSAAPSAGVSDAGQETPAYKMREMSEDDLLFGAKFNVKMDRILSGIPGSARTYKVRDRNCYLYRTTIRSLGIRHRISLSPIVARAIADLGPYFVVVDDEESRDIFVIPGDILSPDRIETFTSLGGRATRSVNIVSAGNRPILRSGEWDLDLTPYKNAFHLLK